MNSEIVVKQPILSMIYFSNFKIFIIGAGKSIKMYERENLLNSIVISVWSGKFNEKEYA